MKKLLLLTSLAITLVLTAAPALAQEAGTTSDATTAQYDPGPDVSIQAAGEQAIEDLVSRGGDPDGAAAYEAALNAARDAGADRETAETVAARAVANVSEETGTAGSPNTETPEANGTSDEEKPGANEQPVAEEPEITELPDTGGIPVFALGTGLLMVGAGLLTRRFFL